MSRGIFLARDFGLTTAVDDGRRPYPGRQPAWLNTSIFLSGGRSQTEAAVGQPSTVKVRVSNRRSMPVHGVRVDAYLFRPHVGPATPEHAVVTLSGGPATVAPGTGSASEADPRVLTCTPQSGTGAAAWFPTEQQLPAGAGQFCLAANCYAPTEGGALPVDVPLADDPHQGERNLLLLVAPIFGGTLLEFDVLPVLAARRTFVELIPLHAGSLDAGERWLLGSHPAVTVSDGGAGRRRRTVRGRDGRSCPIQSAQRPLGAQLAVPGSRPGLVVPLPGLAEPRRAQLRVPAPGTDRPGTLHAVDIVQRDEGGRVWGGLRVLALVIA